MCLQIWDCFGDYSWSQQRGKHQLSKHSWNVLCVLAAEGQRTIAPGPDRGYLTVPWRQTVLKGVCVDLELTAGLRFAHLPSRAMFCNDLKEKYEKRIIIKGVDAETMHTLLDYTYTSKALITKQNVQRVLEAANLFQVREQIDPVLSTGGEKSSSSLEICLALLLGLYLGHAHALSWACDYLKFSERW